MEKTTRWKRPPYDKRNNCHWWMGLMIKRSTDFENRWAVWFNFRDKAADNIKDVRAACSVAEDMLKFRAERKAARPKFKLIKGGKRGNN